MRRVAGICAIFFALAARADETNRVVVLPTVVVEATRLGATSLDTPGSVETLTRVDAEASGATTTAALLERRANVLVRSCGNPALSQVSMRGHGANGFGRVKILVDGEDLNNPDMAVQDLMRVPVRAVERVEVLQGPQTVLHGGDASAGVINVVSDPDDYERRTDLEVHGGSFGGVGGHAGTRGGCEPESVTYYADVDYDHSDGWRDNSQYETWSAKGGVKKRFTDDAWATIKAFYGHSDYGLPGGLMTGAFKDVYGNYGGDFDYGNWKKRARSAEDGSSHARNDTYGVALAAHGKIDDENSVQASFAFRNRKSRSYGCLEYDVYGFSYALKYANESLLCGLENRLDLGFDAKHDVLFAESYNASARSGGDNDYQRFSPALFARDELHVLESLSVFGGVRGEAFLSRDRYGGGAFTRSGASNGSDAAVAGEAGVNWRPVENAKIYAKGTRFYHAPLADELFSSYGIPNMDLEPESGCDFEAGFEARFCREWEVRFAGHCARVDDEILYMNDANRNAPDPVVREGVEASFGWSRRHAGSAGVLYALDRSRFHGGDYDGKDVPLVPRQRVRVHGEWFLVDWLAVRGGFRFVDEQRYGGDFANAGGRMPSYALFDCGARVIPSWSWSNGLALSFDVDNLFDRRYCAYGEYFNPWYVYPANGRAFTFSVRCSF